MTSALAPPDESEVLGGGPFLGVCCVYATLRTAAREAWRRGCNPGGQVLMFPMVAAPPREYRNRLLTRDEALQLDAMGPTPPAPEEATR